MVREAEEVYGMFDNFWETDPLVWVKKQESINIKFEL